MIRDADALLDGPLAIVDLETTGGDPARHRIIEIALIEFDRGAETGRWSSLVNPEQAVAYGVQSLTGISQEMVFAAPRFAKMAQALFQRLAGRLFIAHNVQFDYGFLRSEFARAGFDYSAQTLCTVKLSRRLYRHHRGHSLDALIERHGFACEERHRAMPDAQALVQFLHAIRSEQDSETLAVALQRVTGHTELPAGIDPALIASIPEVPGAYALFDDRNAPLYVGHGRALRSRIRAHFVRDRRSRKDTELAARVQRVDWHRTAGELGALLREAELIAELQPQFNRGKPVSRAAWGFLFRPGAEPGPRLVSTDALEADELLELRGLYRTRAAALKVLRGIEDGQHLAALARLKHLHWPWPGAIGILERQPEDEGGELHVLDKWRYLGCARSEGDIQELLGHALPPFDFERYRVIARHLAAGRLRIVQLRRARARFEEHEAA